MKKYLLDTHYIIWLLLDVSKINKAVLNTIQNVENRIYYSDISLWEIAIKTKTGKLKIGRNLKTLPEAMKIQNIDILPLKQSHIFETLEIPLFENHRDPFDRLLIAQAKIENLTLISDDAKFDLYPEIERIW